jgi:hypothetical protein
VLPETIAVRDVVVLTGREEAGKTEKAGVGIVPSLLWRNEKENDFESHRRDGQGPWLQRPRGRVESGKKKELIFVSRQT